MRVLGKIRPDNTHLILTRRRLDLMRYGRRICIASRRTLWAYAVADLGNFAVAGCRVTGVYVLSALLAVGIGAYLLYALIRPEKF